MNQHIRLVAGDKILINDRECLISRVVPVSASRGGVKVFFNYVDTGVEGHFFCSEVDIAAKVSFNNSTGQLPSWSVPAEMD